MRFKACLNRYLSRPRNKQWKNIQKAFKLLELLDNSRVIKGTRYGPKRSI